MKWSQSTKYLGLTLDKKLTWKQHIIQTRDKFRRAQRAIFPLIGRNSELNLYNKLLLYTAVLRPILTYGSPVWGYAANSNIKILEVAQNSLIRNIVKANRYARNMPPTNHNSAIQTIQDFTAETVCKKISDSVATPPCHVRPTNQDTHSQAGPPT
ncbi:RNA-directed DNA polymerase from mobile element jockey [Trichonephila clavipes]|uniref:RNA-directed DNA polymerase from mobile element jockey n=1 Tax=Trichonephila clavipes TaxID=2585209 RepID=A0A8X6R6E3_TRICX|nr:RNA-directed DNA polymerase from mobile element jockey [Trichonephila clavipes]